MFKKKITKYQEIVQTNFEKFIKQILASTYWKTDYIRAHVTCDILAARVIISIILKKFSAR